MRRAQITAYVEPGLKRRLERMARNQRRTVSTLLAVIATDYLEARDARSRASASPPGHNSHQQTGADP